MRPFILDQDAIRLEILKIFFGFVIHFLGIQIRPDWEIYFWDGGTPSQITDNSTVDE